jgi:CRISPR/Cas system-associated exonuclease Cas4 (RecB family)
MNDGGEWLTARRLWARQQRFLEECRRLWGPECRIVIRPTPGGAAPTKPKGELRCLPMRQAADERWPDSLIERRRARLRDLGWSMAAAFRRIQRRELRAREIRGMNMLARILDAHARATERVFSHRRSSTVGASEIGQCARRTFFRKTGAPIDLEYKDTWGATTRGSIFENEFWEPALRRAFGDRLHLAGADQRTLVDGCLSATPDGLVDGQARDALSSLGVSDIGSDCILVECKTFDPRTRLEAPKPEHVFQVNVQLGLVRSKTPWRPNYALLSYTDAAYWDRVTEFAIPFDETVFANARRRAEHIMRATSATHLGPEGRTIGGQECRFCPFNEICAATVHVREKPSAPSFLG